MFAQYCVGGHRVTFCCFILYHHLFFFSLSFSKASTTSVLFSRCIWLYQLSIAWNEICACVCQWLCALPYLHSRNASTPPKLSRSRRQTTAAVALLFSVSQGAVNQEKTADERRNKEKQTQRNRKNRGHLAWLFLEGPLQQLHTVTKLTGTPRDNRRHPKIPWLSLDHHASWQIRGIAFVLPV